MAVEAPISTPEPRIVEGKRFFAGHENPRYVNIPPRLIDATDGDGAERATFIEFRIRNLLRTQSNIVENVFRNEMGSKEDSVGHDLTVTLKGDPPIKIVHVQVKASGREVDAYKHWIRDNYFPNMENSEKLVRKWMTEHGIILLNGAETKSGAEILESFYPQLERIQQKALREQTPEPSCQMILFPGPKPIQLFP